MSKVKIKGNASGTGVLTIEAPNTNTDRTITLPDEDITLGGGADTSLSNLSSTGDAKVCKAWVNFNGTGTIAIRGSQGVSGLVDNGTGRFSVNFTNAMSNANYAAVTSGGSSGSAAGMGYMYSPSTTATGVEFVNANDDLLDPVYGTTDVNGDLA